MNQCYHNGDFWQCATATAAGESPTSTPAAWRKLVIPSKFRWVLSQLTYAYCLEFDGQTDKAGIARNQALGRDNVGLRDLAAQEEAEESADRRHCGRGRSARVNTGRTRPVKASVILDDVCGLMNWDAANLDAREKADRRRAFSKALQEVWEFWWWQELMTCERMALAEARENFVDYTSGAPVYEAEEDAYFIALDAQACPPLPAASNRWEEFNPDRVTTPLPLWDSGTGYSAGDQFSYSGTDYQCWTTAAAGTLPTDTTKFLPLSNWRPVLPYATAAGGSSAGALVGPFGPIRAAAESDPRVSHNPGYFELQVTATGTEILGLDVTHPWIWARRVTPIIADDCADFDAAETYEATDPEDLVYDS